MDRRRLQYEYFSLDKAFRLFFLEQVNLITPDMADLIPLEFWKRGFNNLMQSKDEELAKELTLFYEIEESNRKVETKEKP